MYVEELRRCDGAEETSIIDMTIDMTSFSEMVFLFLGQYSVAFVS